MWKICRGEPEKLVANWLVIFGKIAAGSCGAVRSHDVLKCLLLDCMYVHLRVTVKVTSAVTGSETASRVD